MMYEKNYYRQNSESLTSLQNGITDKIKKGNVTTHGK